MNIVRIVASTLALVSALAVVPGIAQAAEGARGPEPVTMDRDRGHGADRDHRDDRDGRGVDRDHRRDFDRDWRGYRPAWVGAGMRDDTICRVAWENGASREQMFRIGCFVR